MTLFKYMKADRVDILESERIAFTPPDRFNDAYELRPQVAPVSRGYLKQRAKETVEELQQERCYPRHAAPRSMRRSLKREVIKSAVKRLKPFYAETLQDVLQAKASKHIGILSLSECNDNELLWSHYADGHRGFVIEFDCAHSGFQQLGRPWKVEYSEKRAVYNPQEPDAQYWLIKPICWHYEREYRIIRQLKERKEEQEDNGKLLYLFELPRACVKAVYLGHRLDRAIRERILAALIRTPAEKYDEIPSREDFTFSFREIR